MCRGAFCTAFLSVISIVLSGYAAFGCDFVAAVPKVNGNGEREWIALGFLGINYSTWDFSGTHFHYCESYGPYKDSLWDSTWKAGMAMAIIAFVFGLFATIGSLLFCCGRDVGKKGYTCLTCLFLFTAICQGLSLVALSSGLMDDVEDLLKNIAKNFFNADFTFGINLTVGPGAGCAIAATVFWLICVCTTAAQGKNAAEDEVEETGPAGAEEPLLAEDA